MSLLIKIPEAMRAPVEAAARERGESVEALVQAAIAVYLKQLEDARLVRNLQARREAGTPELKMGENFEAELDEEEDNRWIIGS